jgi:hypothetical protein
VPRQAQQCRSDQTTKPMPTQAIQKVDQGFITPRQCDREMTALVPRQGLARRQGRLELVPA